jgi:hypothetical protein
MYPAISKIPHTNILHQPDKNVFPKSLMKCQKQGIPNSLMNNGNGIRYVNISKENPEGKRKKLAFCAICVLIIVQ